jgi:hypothetical protein
VKKITIDKKFRRWLKERVPEIECFFDSWKGGCKKDIMGSLKT